MIDGLKMLREMKSVVVSTVDGDQPHSRIIDMMHADNEGLYFITLKSKPFYRQLSNNPKLAITAMNKDYVQVRIVGEVKPLGLDKIEELIKANPEMVELFPQITSVTEDDNGVWQVFHVYKGKGETFDLSGRQSKVKRERFAFGDMTVRPSGVVIKDNCIECGQCKKACPFGAISEGKPFKVNPNLCDECGICYSVCPVDAIELPTGM